MNELAKNQYTKVGIFMPCYNMGSYLNESLESIYSQTFSDYQILIADDASTSQRSLKALRNISSPKCEIYFEPSNMGLSTISNKYLSKLNSEYIVLFSPDDKMHPEFLAEQVKYLDEHPDVAAVCVWTQEFEDGSSLIKYTNKGCKLPNMLVENNYSGAAMMRKSAWLECGRYETHKDFFSNIDYVLWLKMLEKGFHLATIPKPLFYWRVVKTSLSHSMSADDMFIFRKAIVKKFSNLYTEYASFVIPRQLEKIRNFESYYTKSEEGHAWLDDQYKKLSAEIQRLNENLEAAEKNNKYLSSRLANAIERPYVRSFLRHIKSKMIST